MIMFLISMLIFVIGFLLISSTFNKKEDKVKYIQYILTPKGVAERTRLTLNFMKRKIKEYDELKKELKRK